MIGALTLLSTREGRHYREQDLAFAETLGERFALAIDNARLYEAAERSLGLLDTLFATAPVGLAFLDTEQRYVRVNEALAAMNGRPVEDHIGRLVDEVPGPLGEQLAACTARSSPPGEPRLDREGSGETPGAPGETRHWISSCTPVRGLDGQTVIGVGVTVIDITERRALLQAERDARLRADFLARAGAILDSSLDFEQTLANVANIAIPEIADWCAVSILDEPGRDARGRDRERRSGQARGRARAQRALPARPRGADRGAGRRAQRRDRLHPARSPTRCSSPASPTPTSSTSSAGSACARLIIAPMTAGGRTFGTLTLASAESGRLFEAADVQLAEELARRAGVAIENSRLYTERTRIAHTLQAELLPDRLPEIPGVVLAARYRAAGELNEVGGDFYDVFPRSETDWALVVGDVSGKGAEAAAITALARYSLRTAAMEEGAPSAALRRLNQAMLSDGTSQFATVVLAYISAAADGGLDVRVALGGHPPPLVLRADGSIEAPGRYGVLLGMLEDPPLHDRSLHAAPRRRDAALHRRRHRGGLARPAARRARPARPGLAAAPARARADRRRRRAGRRRRADGRAARRHRAARADGQPLAANVDR